MAQVLMPKSTAVWLVENTALTFAQIAEFCGCRTVSYQKRKSAVAKKTQRQN